MRVGWLLRGDLEQRTGGYVYDRLVIDGLRMHGNEIRVIDPREFEGSGKNGEPEEFDAVVADALWVGEIAPLFERMAHATARVLLVHHLASWEVEHAGDEAIRAMEARAIAASDHVVATSHATALRLTDGCARRAVDVVVPGADRLRPQPRKVRSDGVVGLVFVGSLIPRKCVPMLLDATEQVADLALTLTIVGDPGRDPEHACEIVTRIDRSAVLRSRVARTGSVDDETLGQVLAHADALVLPSSVEGYGIVVAEALHAGLAVLATRHSAHAANIPGEVALLFDDADGLAKAIRRFVGNPSLRAAMQRAAERSRLPRWTDAVASFQKVLTAAVSEEVRKPNRAHEK